MWKREIVCIAISGVASDISVVPTDAKFVYVFHKSSLSGCPIM